MNQEEFDKLVDEHNTLVLESENKLVEIALEHNLMFMLGEYGNGGRELLLEDSAYCMRKRGEWLYSSETC
jgi:hypothetical protein